MPCDSRISRATEVVVLATTRSGSGRPALRASIEWAITGSTWAFCSTRRTRPASENRRLPSSRGAGQRLTDHRGAGKRSQQGDGPCGESLVLYRSGVLHTACKDRPECKDVKGAGLEGRRTWPYQHARPATRSHLRVQWLRRCPLGSRSAAKRSRRRTARSRSDEGLSAGWTALTVTRAWRALERLLGTRVPIHRADRRPSRTVPHPRGLSDRICGADAIAVVGRQSERTWTSTPRHRCRSSSAQSGSSTTGAASPGRASQSGALETVVAIARAHRGEVEPVDEAQRP